MWENGIKMGRGRLYHILVVPFFCQTFAKDFFKCSPHFNSQNEILKICYDNDSLHFLAWPRTLTTGQDRHSHVKQLLEYHPLPCAPLRKAWPTVYSCGALNEARTKLRRDYDRNQKIMLQAFRCSPHESTEIHRAAWKNFSVGLSCLNR